jgi:hypothetical protein
MLAILLAFSLTSPAFLPRPLVTDAKAGLLFDA